MAGLLIAMTGGLWLVLQSGAPTQPQFMAAVTLFLAGMGLINPIGTAIALEPFGDRAGIASALFGFLQMACAAIGTAIVGALSMSPAMAFAWVVFGGRYWRPPRSFQCYGSESPGDSCIKEAHRNRSSLGLRLDWASG